jgi:hypothetical protein
MRALIDYIKKLFARVPPAVTDEHCPYCRGLGYDSSGWTCTCLREKKGVGLTVDELITLEQKHMRHEDLSKAIADKLKEKK